MSSDVMMPTSGESDRRAAITNRLKLYFASLSCLGGLVLSSGSDNESIPVIAVFFSIFGFLFVDYLQLFALPPIAAYAAMAVAAFYCVSDFADLDEPGNHQMTAVAQLLVFVQAILMLQRKSRRIFEQLGVFCLLELIVAAVFNNAISYGLLLIPIGVIAAWALCLLAAISATEGLDAWDEQTAVDLPTALDQPSQPSQIISVRAPEAVQSLTSVAMRLPRVSLLTLAPAVVLVAAIFFYALPRTTEAARTRNQGNALVGFSDSMSLQQIGQMQQSTARALRVYLHHRGTGAVYDANSLYLRGRVLERYATRFSSASNAGSWDSVPQNILRFEPILPSEYVSPQPSDSKFYDPVTATIYCEAMRSDALFAVAPYHRYQIKRSTKLIHGVDTWTLSRPETSGWVHPAIQYEFGTNAFFQGDQTELIACVDYELPAGLEHASDVVIRQEMARRDEAARNAVQYERELLRYDIDAIPRAAELAKPFTLGPDGKRRTDYEIAKLMESFLSTSNDFSYTLNLNAESLPGVDPIEQFLSVDRRGHCQYFASALVMMLRSVDIPARVVVGYHTDEFNELGQFYVARQLHAHSWVEALIDRDQLDLTRVYGQPETERYWVRLDPTPIAGRIPDSGAGMSPYLDVAQNVWDDYVVDMDASRQREAAFAGPGMGPVSRSYANVVDWLSLKISQIRAGELGGGSLASRTLFSWQGAVLGVMMSVLVVVVIRMRPPAWLRRQLERHSIAAAARPQIEFYAQTLDQLARVGITRQAAQTPDELRKEADVALPATDQLSIAQPLARLTSIFYRARFGTPDSVDPLRFEEVHGEMAGRGETAEIDSALSELTRNVDLAVASGNPAKRNRSEQTT